MRDRLRQQQDEQRQALETAIARAMEAQARRSRTTGSLKSEAAFFVEDARHKVVEEAWFGRPVTPQRSIMDGPDYSQQLGWRAQGDPPRDVHRMGAEGGAAQPSPGKFWEGTGARITPANPDPGAAWRPSAPSHAPAPEPAPDLDPALEHGHKMRM